MRADLLEERSTFGWLSSWADEVGGHADDQVERAGEQLGEPRLVLDDRAGR